MTVSPTSRGHVARGADNAASTGQESRHMDPQTAPPPVQPFSQLLQLQRKGLLHAELSDQLNAVIAGVVEHGKAGSLTVKFAIKTTGDGVVSITDTYNAKIPTPPAEPSIFFADETGQFSRDRLNQERLPFTAVEGAKGAASA